MKKDSIVAVVFLAFILFAFLKRTNAQTTIVLQDYPEWRKKTYNLSGSELYLIINNDSIFVPKIGSFEFRTNKIIDSIFSMADTLAEINILIRNSANEYIIPLPHFLFRTQAPFRVSIYIDNKKNYYSIFLLKTHSSAFCMSNLVIQPNKHWKRKFLN